MTETPTLVDAPGDAELISAVRGGDVSAYGDLFERHVGAARRLARQLVSSADADDLVSDAFAKVLRVLQGGGGPDVSFRAYLLTAVRRLHVDKIRAGAKLHTTDDLDAYDPGVPFRDTAVEGFENAAAAQAFASLPERWQLVLWHTEVEGQKPADIAPLLGMSANSVAALAYRAREGLRQAFLNSHVEEQTGEECRWTHEHLGGYIRGGVSKRDTGKVERHLDECRSCMGIYLELAEVNSNLGAIIAPLLLGAAGAGYLASAGAVVKGGLLVAAFDRAKDLFAGNTQAAAVAGVVAATAVGVGIALATGGGGQVTAEPPNRAIAPATSDSTTSPDDSPTGGSEQDPSDRGDGQDGSDATGDLTPPDLISPTAERSALPEPEQQDGSGPDSGQSGGQDDPTGGSDDPPGGQDDPPGNPNDPPGNPNDPPGNPNDPPGDPNDPPGDPNDPPGDPNDPPGDPDDPTTTPPPAQDLTITATADQMGQGVTRVTVTVQDLAAGTAEVTWTFDGGVTLTGSLDDRCTLFGQLATCTLSAEDAAPIEFKAINVHATTTLTFTVTAVDDTEDSNTNNNTARVDIPPKQSTGGGGG